MAKKLPASFRALGKHSLPERIELDDGTYALVHEFKHDFFAVTGLYEGAAGKVVLKIGRTAGFFGLPMGWIGRYLAAHEAALYLELGGLPGIPRWRERFGKTGIVHDYVEGAPLRKDAAIADGFFRQLSDLLAAIHQRNVAYVDLEKRENVLVGEDGRPYLFDFQISWYLPRRYGGRTWPARWLLRKLQEGDRYHLLKHWRRLRPDELTPEQRALSRRRSWAHRLHGWLTRPLTLLRRAALRRVDPARAQGEHGESAKTTSEGNTCPATSSTARSTTCGSR